MCSLSPKQKSNIIFMLESGKSVHDIASKLGIGKSTVGEVQSEIKSSLKDNHGGHPSKLTPQD
jgi:DNA-binding NarL/FixJ family response regulator